MISSSHSIKQIEKAGTLAVKKLRESKFRNGLPFMINSKELPSDQCYLEYADGTIELVVLSRKDNDFKIITKISTEEGKVIRRQLKLL